MDEALEFLLSKVDSEQMQKIKVWEEEDFLSDTAAFYKGNRYNPAFPIRVQFMGQEAADAGGPFRQLFTKIFDKFNTEDDWFIGSPYRPS